MQMFDSPEMTEKQKACMELNNIVMNCDVLRETLNSIENLLRNDLLTVDEAQAKADKALNEFNVYLDGQEPSQRRGIHPLMKEALYGQHGWRGEEGGIPG